MRRLFLAPIKEAMEDQRAFSRHIRESEWVQRFDHGLLSVLAQAVTLRFARPNSFKVACIDDWKNQDASACRLFQSDFLLQSSDHFEHAGTNCRAWHRCPGRQAGSAHDCTQDDIVRQNNDGILFLFRKNRISFIEAGALLTGWKAMPIAFASVVRVSLSWVRT